MKERKEILSQFRANRNKIINDNSDIFSSCKCMSNFHKFFQTVNISGTEDASNAEKSQCIPIGKVSKKRFSFSGVSLQTPSCRPVTPIGLASSSQTEETASPNLVTPFFICHQRPGTTLSKSHYESYKPRASSSLRVY